MLHGSHIKDTKVLNLGGERHPQQGRKENNLNKKLLLGCQNYSVQKTNSSFTKAVGSRIK